MKKKNLKIVKFVSFLLLIFSFNLNVNAETTKIYYADENGIRKFEAEAPTGYPKNEGGVSATLYRYRTLTGGYAPTLYHVCAADETSTVVKYQTMECGAEDSADKTLTYEKETVYSCVKTDSDSVVGNIVKGYDTTKGDVCDKYSEWSSASTEKPNGYDEKNTDLYQSATGTVYYWYKEVANGTSIDFTNNKILYDAIKSRVGKTQIKNAEINFIEEKDKNNNVTYKIVAADISKVTELLLYSEKINDITQLGKFTGLTFLLLSDNYIVSIEPIVGLKKLETLNIQDNDITNLGLLKKIENYDSIDIGYFYNDYKKSGIIKSWSDFVREVTKYYQRRGGYSVASTQDSMEITYDGETYAKFEYKNNILKLTYYDDYNYWCSFFPLYMSITHTDEDTLEKCQYTDFKCYFSKYGDYLKLDYTYDEDKEEMTKLEMSFDLRYFYGDDAVSKNPKTGVPNALILLGITLMSSAIGFVIIYKHKTGIQL